MKSGSAEEEWREDCAPRRVLELFSTKWTSMVLHTLAVRHEGTARSNALHRSLPAISKKMLIQTLREMETAGIVLRTEHPTVPPSVEYGLTALGRQLVEPIELIYDWARRNASTLDALQPRATSRRR
ncbi:helix-turn-helix transcriptional regulator [Stenotrophomonas sp. 169]|jgi:DNA-binding HxlR family transcriptional regulator|uniref:winged helix-turn-helix transcriptional regulator n=1 Tax=Stenotrophomonas sp. 169 TaxID=2770322 RepID=UPI00166267A9|nr:helix-turn-helix domain-containing protein [Stenotrophomonas sp. 169]QNR98839.1 helix-turn-helix transcriptional regulator [Stenotrophomonas sp. 169]